MDQQTRYMILVLLDLSNAFDTLDHSMLLSHIEPNVGSIRSTCLEDRRQSVVIPGASTSQSVKLEYGVPQGSVLGPKLFTVYTQLPLPTYVGNINCQLRCMLMTPNFTYSLTWGQAQIRGQDWHILKTVLLASDLGCHEISYN